jgi:hypothetical protein
MTFAKVEMTKGKLYLLVSLVPLVFSWGRVGSWPLGHISEMNNIPTL